MKKSLAMLFFIIFPLSLFAQEKTQEEELPRDWRGLDRWDVFFSLGVFPNFGKRWYFDGTSEGNPLENYSFTLGTSYSAPIYWRPGDNNNGGSAAGTGFWAGFWGGFIGSQFARRTSTSTTATLVKVADDKEVKKEEPWRVIGYHGPQFSTTLYISQELQPAKVTPLYDRYGGLGGSLMLEYFQAYSLSTNSNAFVFSWFTGPAILIHQAREAMTDRGYMGITAGWTGGMRFSIYHFHFGLRSSFYYFGEEEIAYKDNPFSQTLDLSLGLIF